eukprot:TRINITY_DN6636_c0_g2_i1.p1 TRINITY_DN6636_c0_g2~~TRINITY_DN6636_c0_g2_i1.p1  ORF type:complete len:416 (+),score=18.53 TRINITY_DN6636_c0_g2_i1:340-1587(+)
MNQKIMRFLSRLPHVRIKERMMLKTSKLPHAKLTLTGILVFFLSTCSLRWIYRPKEITWCTSAILGFNVGSYAVASFLLAKPICNFGNINYFVYGLSMFALYQRYIQTFIPLFQLQSKLRYSDIFAKPQDSGPIGIPGRPVTSDWLKNVSVLAAISSKKAYKEEPFLINPNNENCSKVIEDCGVKVICDGTVPGLILITFRGTEKDNLANWLNNFCMGQTVVYPLRGVNHNGVTPEPVAVHSGFWTAYSAVRGELFTALDEIIKTHREKYKNSIIVACGHSYGGALAELSSLDRRYGSIITFNSPACGDEAFGSFYRSQGTTSLRYANESDSTRDFVNRAMDIFYGFGIAPTWYQHPCRTFPVETGHSWWDPRIHSISVECIYKEVFTELPQGDIEALCRKRFTSRRLLRFVSPP